MHFHLDNGTGGASSASWHNQKAGTRKSNKTAPPPRRTPLFDHIHDISHSTLHRWVQGIRNSGSTRATDNRTPGRNEPVELRKRNRQLEMEVDVSEQAAPVFARK